MRKKNILLFSTIGPKWIRDVKNLLLTKPFCISGYITTSKINKDVCKVLDEAIFYNRNVDMSVSYKTIIDSDLLNFLSKYDREIFYILERGELSEFHGNSFMMSLIYYKTIQYCQQILAETKPDIIIFGGVPHNGVSIILYYLIKYYGTNHYILERLKVKNFYGYFKSIEFKHPKVIESYNKLLLNNETISLSKSTLEYISIINNRYNNGKNRGIVKSFHGKNPLSALFYEIFHLQSGQLRSLNNLIINIRLKLKQNSLKHRYESLCLKTVDLNSNYIFVALHQQPEKTTSPDGGVYSQQWLMINNLISVIPNDWNIYIKEHPATFLKYSDAIFRYRSEAYYKQLTNFPNVHLISIDHNQDDLIDNSKFVVTVTGTPAIEAAIRGIPALVFGFAHYVGCEGIFYVNDSTYLKESVDRIVNGYKVDEVKVMKYLSALENTSSIVYDDEFDMGSLDSEERLKFKLFSKIIENEMS